MTRTAAAFAAHSILLATLPTLGQDCPGDGDCFEDNGTPGCEDVDCCEAVCGFDSFCCDFAWDLPCVLEALQFCEYDHCVLECDGNELEEPEVCGDDTSGGCASTPPTEIDLECGQVFCGTGWAEGGTRDTDWYAIDFAGGTISATLESEFPGVVFVVTGYEQCSPMVVAAGNSGLCLPMGTAVAESLEPGLQVVFVATVAFDGFPCGVANRYRVTVECSDPPCPADVNGDEVVGVDDMVEVILVWGSDDPAADINGDGIVSVLDLTQVIVNWGTCG